MVFNKKNTEQYIWYNPVLNRYQSGTKKDYDLIYLSRPKAEFTLLYRMNGVSSRMADKLITELNGSKIES